MTVDAVVVGSGPNGLVAAARIARRGGRVIVFEAASEPGGGLRSEHHDGWTHDLCATIHALAAVAAPLRELGLVDVPDAPITWSHFPAELGHALEDRPSPVLHRDVERTAEGLGADAGRYRRLVGGLVDRWDALAADVLRPVVGVPRHPVALTRFGAAAILPAAPALRRLFRTPEARALLAGNAAHSYVPLTKPLTMSFALMLQVSGHVAGWPVATGGSGRIADALIDVITDAGGEVRTDSPIEDLASLPEHRALFLDTTPSGAHGILGAALPKRHDRAYRRFRHGAAAFKIDYELSGPMPWADPRLTECGTVHVVGSMDELVAAEATVAAGRMPDRPFVLVTQAGLADGGRAPDGGHTLWTYAHVPAGFDGDATPQLEGQLDRFAPGWRDLVIRRHVRRPADFEARNRNYVRGDIGGGSYDGLQAIRRPVLSPHPYRTGVDDVWLCSASTPPGGGTHGMAGWNAVADALDGPLRHLADGTDGPSTN